MTEQEIPDPPEESQVDGVHSLVKVGLGYLPAIGPLAAELYGRVVKAPLEKRSEEWMKSVTAHLRHADQQGHIDLEAAMDQPEFQSVFLKASKAALDTHQAEKLAALRNAVVNAAAEPGDGQLSELFLRFVDELQPWHLRLLAFYADPAAVAGVGSPVMTEPFRSAPEAAAATLGDFDEDPGLAEHASEDLRARKLIDDRPLLVTPGNPALRVRATALGRRFLAFIRSEWEISPSKVEGEEPTD